MPHFVLSMEKGPVRVSLHSVKRRRGVGALMLRYEVGRGSRADGRVKIKRYRRSV